jgi:hypothetical protein
MLSKALAMHLGISDPTPFLAGDTITIPNIPAIKFSHDDQANLKTPEELSTSKSKYKNKKVIFLVRDIRDVIVSYYFELTKRNVVNPHYPQYQGNLSSFLRYKQGSVDTIIRYYNIWAENQHVPADFLLIRYEDIHNQPEKELRRVLDFIGLPSISDKIDGEAVRYASFDIMHKMEESTSVDSFKLQPGDKQDPESYKTRRGKIHGFTDYLSQDDIEYLDKKIHTELIDYFGYR